jgi:hypothetical protein
MSKADDNRLARRRRKLGQAVAGLVYDSRTLFGLDRLGLFPQAEQDRLIATDRREFDRRVDEASSLALDQLIEPHVELWLGARKVPLLVTRPAADLPHHGRNERFQP